MLSQRRLDRIAGAFPPCAPELSEAELYESAVRATRAGVWSWTQARRLLEPHLDDWRTDILDLAQQARRRRLRGDPPHLEWSMDLVAEIVSYAPGETPPPMLAQGIEDHLYDANRVWSDVPAVNVVHAVIGMLILGTPHGMALRQERVAREKNAKRSRRRRRTPGTGK